MGKSAEGVKIKTRAITITVVIFLGVILSFRGASAEQIHIGGGGASLSSMFFPFAGAFEEETGIRLELTPSSPLQGLIDLEKGVVDLATGLSPLDALISEASAKNMRLDRDSFRETVIGRVRIVVFINKGNNVTALSKAQLKNIFTGKISNWKSVGGEDKEITVVWGDTPGQNARFMDVIMDNESLLGTVTKARSYAEIREAVRTTPGAIGIDPEGFINGTINFIITSPEVNSPSYAFTKGDPSAKILRLFDYINKMNF